MSLTPKLGFPVGVVAGDDEQQRLFSEGLLVRLSEDDDLHELIKRRFMASLGSLRPHVSVVAVHRNSRSSAMGLARALVLFVSSSRTRFWSAFIINGIRDGLGQKWAKYILFVEDTLPLICVLGA